MSRIITKSASFLFPFHACGCFLAHSLLASHEYVSKNRFTPIPTADRVRTTHETAQTDPDNLTYRSSPNILHFVAWYTPSGAMFRIKDAWVKVACKSTALDKPLYLHNAEGTPH
jgi:hypothetical protein